MNPTIQVTINPEGTARECHPMGDRPTVSNDPLRNLALAHRKALWDFENERLRTFEIEFVCICDFTNMSGCNIICNPHDLDTSKVYTAEILETYPEPREGIFGRVKIIS